MVDLNQRRQPDPCVIVIFGASGDLAKRKLLPALYNLHVERLIPDNTTIFGTSRTEYGDEDFRRQMHDAVVEHSRMEMDEAAWPGFAKDIYYITGDVTKEEDMTKLKERLDGIDTERGTNGNRVWYMALLPQFFGDTAEAIAKSGMFDTGGWHRLIIEKPYGFDLASALELSHRLEQHYNEDQLFRIDHYLGKETVQNLLVFRFANAIFEPIWNRRHIDNIQITVAEDIGIEGRGSFYERVGAIRDVAQNHLLQLLALTAMEPPVAWDADAIRDEKVKALRAVRRWSPRECETTVVRGQYEDYRDEPNVEETSATETFVAMKLLVDNWRWAGVPFYVRTGKKLASRDTEIVITFKAVPHLLFKKTAVEQLQPNSLIIRIQPDEGFTLTFGAKEPGPAVNVRSVDMEFDYDNEFPSGTPEAYERLLLDCMNGDATLFARADEIREAWEIIDPILAFWKEGGRPAPYESGTWGPDPSEELPRADGRRWSKK